MGKNFILVFLFFVLLVSSVSGATYYVCDNSIDCNSGEGYGWNTETDSNACDSKSFPCKTIRGGIVKLLGGDTIIIGDGNYTGIENMMSTESWNYVWTRIR